ncbi:sodium-dependent bicarbonate transport family permease [Hydrogenophaga crassostreae]|uniref:Sodium-dependent bicarbonate transport family permease n=1 Tax=Hydrogenophaga crassostreae TaxID=1763535 RepID=A0A167GDS3_9BURK|nr:sodium-dependent bicarbonate transport family permease [Hydrogenophaga crassostreae]AOW15223.1 sodium-dependent bicarbonate transport family permease [Hydrogenophaga crassostreae]OAD39309.1 sodium-dependent bicarbonate transport family permease [Hydrogenophaga crassostreae]
MIDVVVLFFLLGVFARLVKSDLRLPEPLYETLSIYLLLAIGLKGGIELSKQPVLDLLPQMLACMALGFAIPLVLTPVLRLMGLSRVDAASMAAHYGSVSVVTFAVASAYLAAQGVPAESHAALWVALMEAPGIVAGILLARLGAPSRPGEETQGVNWRELAHDVFLGKSVLLLAGGLLIGTLMGEAGTAPIAPVFLVPFKGLLALFLLELGLVAGGRLGELRRYGVRIVGFALVAPPFLAMAGALTGWALGLSLGGVTIMATLAASASYIAAPTAMRMAVPEANAALSITAALGVTFPFNIVLGVPLYLEMARWLVSGA